MKQRFCLFFVLCMLCLAALAQSSMIDVSRDARLNRTAQLGGKAGVLFHSKSPDLVISTTVNSDPKVTMPKALGNNVYEYEMLFDVSGAADRVFKVSKKGTVISTKTGQVLLKANEYTAFNVDIVDKPIYMELSDEGGHYILHGNGWALIEINSEIRIIPNYNPRLKLEHRSSRSMAGVYVDSLIINVEALQSLSARLETVRKELNRLNAEYDNLLAQNTSESALNRLDRKIKEVETTVSSLSKELDELSYISVKGDGTNERVIDAEEILAMKSKDKRKYNVILQSKPHGGSAFARPFVTSQYVLFKVTPQNALVELDGQTLDVSDGTATKRMPFGTYSYRVQAPRHAVKSGTIVVNDPNAKHVVNITLEPQYVNAKFSVANNAEIWIDEQKRGTGSCTLELGYGTYLVECRLPGYKSSIQEILIGRNSATGTIALNPPIPIYGSVDINTTPADAEVWIDGKQVGTTPMLLSECIVGEHKLRISKLGYKDYTGNLTIKEGQTTTSSIALEKDLATIKNSPIVQSDDARIMKFLRGYPNGLRITNDGTAIDSKGSTIFDIKFVDDNHFSVSVYGSTAYSSFTNRTLVLKLSNGRGVVTNDELRRCRYNSFTASFTISDNILTVYLSYTTAAYSSYSVKREYTLKDAPTETPTPEVSVSYNAVDLGLPSGTLWADRNVGADSPEDYGDYFAWGETEPKSTYNWSTYKWCRGSATMTKYCAKSSNGTVDNKTVLDLEDDAAYVNMGADWRMPTYDELKELKSKCTWTWTSQNGTKGYRVTGPNGKSIFLPAAGYRLYSYLRSAGSFGFYWSSSLYWVTPDGAWELGLFSDYRGMRGSYRDEGGTVRAVVRLEFVHPQKRTKEPKNTN